MFLTFPGILSILILLFILYCIIFIYEKEHNLLLWILRLVSVSILIFLLLEPIYVLYNKKSKPNLAILIDSSLSIKFNQRFTQIKSFLNTNLTKFKNNFSINLYQFSSNISSIDEKDISKLNANGKYTDITNAVNQVVMTDTTKYDSLLLISDGQHNVSNDILNTVKSLDIPVYTLYPDETKLVSDTSIMDIRCSDYALKNVPFEISVIIYSSNLINKVTNIYLRRNKEIVTTKKIFITKDGYDQIDFIFTSTKLGLETYTVEIAPLSEETVISNNTRSFELETIREKLRILYICGQPNPEYYFLRYFLKSDPKIELVSFVILRNPENIAVVPDEQLSLIPFPANEIFLKDLFDYDIFILENFNYARFYIYTPYLENVKRFVKEKGGGFLMIAGDNAFGKGGYKGTPVEHIVPVELDTPDAPIQEGLFNLRILVPNHPLMLLSDDPKESEKIWTSIIPQFDGCQMVTPKIGATTLAVHPYAKTDKGNLVVVSCAEYGKGRSIALGTNTTWRMALSAESSAGKKYYVRFWKNVIKWLSKSEETKNFRISILHKKYFPNDKIEIKLIVMDNSLKNSKPKLYVTDPYLRTKQILDLSDTYYGWKTNYTLDQIGKYKFSARIEKDNKIVATDSQTLLAVDETNKEELQLSLNIELMKKIAELSSGKSFSISDFNMQDMSDNIGRTSKPAIKKQINIKTISIIYFVIFILFIVEWFIRRIKGLL